jgi:hypothetical protein
MIREKKNGFYVMSEKTGRSLGGPYPNKEEAERREKLVEFFKKDKPKERTNPTER